jgi:cation transporter-like permease
MRLALTQGIQPRRYALGAAAALVALHPALLDGEGDVGTILQSIWSTAVDEQHTIIQAIEAALRSLRAWQNTNFHDPQRLDYR